MQTKEFPVNLDEYSATNPNTKLDLDKVFAAEIDPCPSCGEVVNADIVGRRVLYNCRSCGFKGDCDFYGTPDEKGLENEFDSATITLHSRETADI